MYSRIVLIVVCWRYGMLFDANGSVSTLMNVDWIEWMYFCVNEFYVGVNVCIFSGNEQQRGIWKPGFRTRSIRKQSMIFPLGLAKIKQQEFFFVSSFVRLLAYAWTMTLCLQLRQSLNLVSTKENFLHESNGPENFLCLKVISSTQEFTRWWKLFCPSLPWVKFSLVETSLYVAGLTSLLCFAFCYAYAYAYA